MKFGKIQMLGIVSGLVGILAQSPTIVKADDVPRGAVEGSGKCLTYEGDKFVIYDRARNFDECERFAGRNKFLWLYVIKEGPAGHPYVGSSTKPGSATIRYDNPTEGLTGTRGR